MLTRSWRGSAPGRPALPLPPERMPLVRGGRPLKRWTLRRRLRARADAVRRHGRASASIPFSWWAVWDGERAARGRARRLDVDDRAAARTIEVVSPHGAPVRVDAQARGARAVRFEARIDLRGIVDESAGYHARHTVVALVGGRRARSPPASRSPGTSSRGIHDAPEASERTVWVAGEPREVPPVAFDGLRGVGGLRFEPVAVRAARENYLLVRSDYEQPFGTFTGELPGAAGARGLGVMAPGCVMRGRPTSDVPLGTPGREPRDRGGCSARMRPMSRIALLAAVAFAALTGTAHAGGWATVELGEMPSGLVAGEPWQVELIVKQHGITPMAGVTPERARSTDGAGAVAHVRRAPDRQGRALRRRGHLPGRRRVEDPPLRRLHRRRPAPPLAADGRAPRAEPPRRPATSRGRRRSRSRFVALLLPRRHRGDARPAAARGGVPVRVTLRGRAA